MVTTSYCILATRSNRPRLKFIHEIRSIITFDCRENYSDIQQSSTRKTGSAQKKKKKKKKKKNTKNARGAREIAFAAIFISQIIWWMFHLKEKQTAFRIIVRRMTTEKGARAVGILRKYASIRQVSQFSRECLQIPVSYDKCRCLR